ncbi:hypothetical protein SXCC_01157 [Gluconacetobacter sp. SXCC-1]|nr:hypothetical protein SXCC_01157 [Gluconacetobacter sp. SXCC-1]
MASGLFLFAGAHIPDIAAVREILYSPFPVMCDPSMAHPPPRHPYASPGIFTEYASFFSPRASGYV